jgi:acetyl esterase/lipase
MAGSETGGKDGGRAPAEAGSAGLANGPQDGGSPNGDAGSSGAEGSLGGAAGASGGASGSDDCVGPSSGTIVPGDPAPSCDAEDFASFENLAYGPDDQHRVDVYLPAATGPFPTVIWIHGGGWLSGNRKDIEEASFVLCAGFALASIDYRFSTEAAFPARTHDVKAAIRYLRANAETLELDPDHFVLFGSSAGGQIASMAGASDGVAALEDLSFGNETTPSRVSAVVDWYGPTEFASMDAALLAQGCPEALANHSEPNSPESQLLGCTVGEPACADEVASASPVSYVGADDPPFLIMHGTTDCAVPAQQSLYLAAALGESSVCASYQSVVGAGHGGPAWLSDEVQDVVLEFLQAGLAL